MGRRRLSRTSPNEAPAATMIDDGPMDSASRRRRGAARGGARRDGASEHAPVEGQRSRRQDGDACAQEVGATHGLRDPCVGRASDSAERCDACVELSGRMPHARALASQNPREPRQQLLVQRPQQRGRRTRQRTRPRHAPRADTRLAAAGGVRAASTLWAYRSPCVPVRVEVGGGGGDAAQRAQPCAGAKAASDGGARASRAHLKARVWQQPAPRDLAPIIARHGARVRLAQREHAFLPRDRHQPSSTERATAPPGAEPRITSCVSAWPTSISWAGSPSETVAASRRRERRAPSAPPCARRRRATSRGGRSRRRRRRAARAR